MNGLRGVLLRCALGAVVAVAALVGAGKVWGAPPSGSGHEIAGTYAAEKISLSDTEAQMTLHVYLTNSLDREITVSSAALESLTGGASQDLEGSTTIPAKSTANFSHSVTISRDEYATWKAGGHPLLVVKFSGADANDTVRKIALLPAASAGAN